MVKKANPLNHDDAILGNQDDTLMDEEREKLYDYIYRMTGDMAASHKGLEEVTSAVLGEASQYRDYDELRLSLYSTGRSFNIELWNAPTGHLKTQSHSLSEKFEDFNSDKEELYEEGGFYDEIERIFCGLGGEEREVLILHMKAGFSLEETSKIMGVPIEVTKERLLAAAAPFKDIIPEGQSLVTTLSKLPHHPEPEDFGSSTMALSEVIENVRNGRGFSIPPWLILALIVIGTVLLLANYKAFF